MYRTVPTPAPAAASASAAARLMSGSSVLNCGRQLTGSDSVRDREKRASAFGVLSKQVGLLFRA